MEKDFNIDIPDFMKGNYKNKDIYNNSLENSISKTKRKIQREKQKKEDLKKFIAYCSAIIISVSSSIAIINSALPNYIENVGNDIMNNNTHRTKDLNNYYYSTAGISNDIEENNSDNLNSDIVLYSVAQNILNNSDLTKERRMEIMDKIVSKTTFNDNINYASFSDYLEKNKFGNYKEYLNYYNAITDTMSNKIEKDKERTRGK